ncbi:hypothetical protein GC173_01495 [bacterium]|nr:hypothetical protein [bacterium]
MTEAPPDGTRPVIAEWLRRVRALALLQGQAGYRRAGYRLNLYALRSWIRLPVLGGSVALAVAAGALAEGVFNTPSAAWSYLQAVILAGATLLGAALYRTEQQAGTLELVWLASGSERALLRLRMFGAMAALLVLVLPSAIVLSTFLDGGLAVPHVLIHGGILGYFLLSTLALSATFLPQAWAAALAMGSLHAVLLWSMHGSASILNPFIDPWQKDVAQGSLIAARILQLGLGTIFLRSTAARLRKAM